MPFIPLFGKKICLHENSGISKTKSSNDSVEIIPLNWIFIPKILIADDLFNMKRNLLRVFDQMPYATKKLKSFHIFS